MSPLSADLQTTFSKLRAECLPLSHCTTCADLWPSPSTVIALRIPWKKVFLPKISRCLLQNPNRSPLIGGLGAACDVKPMGKGIQHAQPRRSQPLSGDERWSPLHNPG